MSTNDTLPTITPDEVDTSSVQDKLFDGFQKLMISIVIPTIVDYVNNRDNSTPLTDEDLITNALEVPSSTRVGIVIQSSQVVAAKKHEWDGQKGCQRIMTGRVTTKTLGAPCGEKVYKNAIFCTKCMRLVTFQAQVASLVASRGLTMEEATAGYTPPAKRTGGQFNPVTPPQYYQPQPQPQPPTYYTPAPVPTPTPTPTPGYSGSVYPWLAWMVG